MNPRHQPLLQLIADGETRDGNRDIKNPEEGQRFDKKVRELQALSAYGWIDLKLQKNYMSHQSEWYAASYQLTEEGKTALAEKWEKKGKRG